MCVLKRLCSSEFLLFQRIFGDFVLMFLFIIHVEHSYCGFSRIQTIVLRLSMDIHKSANSINTGNLVIIHILSDVQISLLVCLVRR